MRAVVYDRYGPPDVLRLVEVERPVPREEGARQVRATTVTRSDSGVRSASPFIAPLVSGLRRPKRTIFGAFPSRLVIPGSELAGKVEATVRGRGGALLIAPDELERVRREGVRR